MEQSLNFLILFGGTSCFAALLLNFYNAKKVQQSKVDSLGLTFL